MKRVGWLIRDDRGSILNIALIILLLLTVMGFAALYNTNTELKISSNFKADTVAFYAAVGGLEEVKDRLRGKAGTPDFAGDPDIPPDPLWSAYVFTASSPWIPTDDPNYNANLQNNVPTGILYHSKVFTANSTAPGMSYLVGIRHKREYDAEQAGHSSTTPHYFDNDGWMGFHSMLFPGRVIYYGYGDPLSPSNAGQFTTATAVSSYKPVDIISAYGFNGQTTKMLQVEVAKNPGPGITATVYAKGDVTGNGSSLVVDGTDNCGALASLPPVYTMDPSVTNLAGSPTLGGSPPAPVTGTSEIDIVSYINEMKGGDTTILTSDQNGVNYGSPTDFTIIYSNTSNPYNVGGLKLSNVTGYGVLLVEGDLTLGGGFNWNGLILVSGVLVFNGGGSGINIKGAVLANQTVDINGGVVILYDSCMIADALNTLAPVVISWKEVY